MYTQNQGLGIQSLVSPTTCSLRKLSDSTTTENYHRLLLEALLQYG